MARSAAAGPRTRADIVLGSQLLRLLDLLCLSAALLLLLVDFYLREGSGPAVSFFALRISVRNLLLELALLMCWRFLFWVAGLYQARLTPSLQVALWRVPLATLTCTALVLPVLLLRNADHELFRSLFAFWLISTVLLLVTRSLLLGYNAYVRPSLRRRRTVVICGTGLRARILAMELPLDREYRYTLAGFVDSDPQPECTALAPVLGDVDGLEDILMRQPIDEVLIALPVKSRFSDIQHVVAVCGRAGIQIQYSLDLFTTEIAKHREMDSSARVTLSMVNKDQRLHVKNAFDWMVAAVALLVLSPLFLLIAVLIKATSRGPVFFVQQRFGMHKRLFGMIKFRSMVHDAEARQPALEHLNEAGGPVFKMRRDPRVTRVGALLRRTSLDELPQLINVLRGEMSLVGPRPLPGRDVQRFSQAWLMRRFSVKPGITGLWQVSGRSDTDFYQAIKLDLRYIDRWSLVMDIKILLRTFHAVLRSRGAY